MANSTTTTTTTTTTTAKAATAAAATTTTTTTTNPTTNGTATTAQPNIIQWIVDTRDLWPAAVKTSQLETEAARALALLTPDERKSVLRYMFVRDAKMSLASHLIKRYVISKNCDVGWWEAQITRNAKGKPVYEDPRTGTSPIEFNVSHQAGLVAMVASHGHSEPIEVGVDVVCVDERVERDHMMIAREGWPAFVDMHADVFAPCEANYLKYQILSAIPGAVRRGATTARDTVDFKLRCFYTLWCLREAYVKMTGDALLAPWLKSLEFRHFAPPAPQDGVVRDIEVWLHGAKVEDANMVLRAMGPNYMTCTAVRTPDNKDVGLGIELGPYQRIELEDIVEYAEGRI